LGAGFGFGAELRGTKDPKGENVKRTLLLFALLPLACALPSDQGQKSGGDSEVVVRLEAERAAQKQETSKLRAELEQVRRRLAEKERAEEKRKLEEEKARERARLDARFAGILKRLEELGSLVRQDLRKGWKTEFQKDLTLGLRKEMDQKIEALLLKVQGEQERNRQALAQLLEKRLGRLEETLRNPKEPWKKELGSLSALFGKERALAAKDRESLRRDFEAFLQSIWGAFDKARKDQESLANKFAKMTREAPKKHLPAPEVNLEALVETVLKKIHPLVKKEVQGDMQIALESSLKAKLHPILKPLKERILRNEALREKRAKDLDLKVTALGRAVDSLVRAVRTLQVQKSRGPKTGSGFSREASNSKVPSEETSKVTGLKAKETPAPPAPKDFKNPSHKAAKKAVKKSSKKGINHKSPEPIRRRKAGLPVFGEGDGFFERPEYWIPSLVGLLFIFVLLGRRPVPREDEASGSMKDPSFRSSSRSFTKQKSERANLLVAGPRKQGTSSTIHNPSSPSSPSPMHLSLRIPAEELSPGGEEAVRAFLASESMVLVRPEPRVDRRGDGSLSIRFYIPGSLSPHIRRDLREHCEGLAIGHIPSTPN
jgi:hypothetical protein